MGSAEHDIDGNESGTDGAMASNFIKALRVLESTAPEGDKPITIIMNNVGGCEYAGGAVYDAIRACRNHTTIEVFGHAMSMGSVILQAADLRRLAPSSRTMLHYGTWGIEDHPQNTYRWAEEGKKLDAWMEQIYLNKIQEKHPKYTLAKVQKLLQFDTFLNAQEAVELGLADEVIE